MIIYGIGKYKFKKPLELTAHKDAEGWSLINEDLAIYAYGDTFDQALISLEDEIESLLICFSKYDSKEIVDGDLLKKRLKEYLN